MMKNRKGISLIVLVITIIVIAILAATVILLLINNNTLDQSKKAKFMSDYRTVQEGVNVFSLSKYNAQTNEFALPLKGYLTDADKTDITNNVPTLKTKIEELSGTLDTVNLAWISSEDIGVKLSSEKAAKGYILDVANGLIYDYNGDYFEGQRWHTLDGGVISDGSTGGGPQIVEELWDGWIKLTLYYPPNSTEKQWRLGTEGELRADPMLMWQNYTGPINIPLDRVKDVWIKYKIDNKEVIIPPAGTLLVDIVPDKTGYTKVPGVKVHINFDETATTKEYRIGDSNWMPYTGEFDVTENCIVEARAKKTETIYNTDGTILTTRNIAGRDLVYISNIGIEETDLAAPTITRLPPVGTEKARVQVTYPANADKKIYKVNYGIEENYTTEINVQSYGTYIIAYYYDASGKRSKSSAILINDTSGGATPEQPKPYDPSIVPTPKNDIVAPTVVVNPTSLVEEVQVSISAPSNADKVYIKLGRYGDYQLYTSPITVRENMDVYAYYRTYMGEKSSIGYGRVSNIKEYNKPYVRIDADPYPYTSNYGASEVNVTINYSDAATIEYSEDGVVYKPYTAPFKITENKTIYARGTNSYGVTETSLNITNIGKIKAPTPLENLSVGINVNPEPTLSTSRYVKAAISIDYDSKATEKYYRIGTYGELKTYTGTFEVTSNCTIYAIAKGANAIGQTSKRIDNLSNGIAEPVISTVPGNSEQASKVSVTIDYDKYSKIKRYSIDGGALRDYSSPFEVTKNGSVIYAYSENDVGQKSESRYTINNIVPEPPMLLLDKGQYYILKLNYPEGSKNREYKWKENGTWGPYKESGILLIKPQYKDQLLQNGTLVKIQDESGNVITFTGDYYFIDVPISELSENLFMRWDREPLGAPQIVITPTEPAMQVTANIVYSSNLVKKLYKVVNPDGSIKTDWTDYTGPITIDRNNSIVYAKGMDDTEVWTTEAMKKITNIDENPPVISLTADLSTAQQKVAVKVAVTDDVGVGKVKWAAGIQGESYFTTAGTEIQNNSIVSITSNGYYTFYAEDQVGNKQVYTLNVTNVDLTAPKIDITVNPETTVGLNANVTINYGDSVTKQYKVGTSNSTWTNYTNTFAISSYTVLSNNWQNADGTVTIYAKGKDAANNEITVEKKVLSLDLDRPNSPIINSNSTYATLYEYGAKLDATTTITFDQRTDINNYYSIDNGTTWVNYTGQFEITSGTVIAKSVKKTTGLEVSTSQTIAIPADALKQQAYDNNDATVAVNGWIKIDSGMINKTIRIKLGYCNISFYSSDRTTLIQNVTYDNNVDITLTIPQNTSWIKVSANRTGGGSIYEIQPCNEPKFNITTKYMVLSIDQSKAIREPYQLVSINYYPTSVQRLYRIGSSGNWISYNDQPISLKQGEIIYAKGIDKYGNETRLISSYTANLTDALKKEAYDGNDTTSAVSGWVQVDSTMIGKKIVIKLGYCIVGMYASDRTTLIQSTTYDSNGEITVTIPQNCQWIKVSANRTGGGTVYEIKLIDEATFSATSEYMLLHADPTMAVKTPYQMVSINYFPTSVQRLYRIGTTGEWVNYQDQPIKVDKGLVIYAKGIDKYGIETRVISSYTSTINDALPKEAYDGNDATYVYDAASYYMKVDSSMQGKNIRVYGTKSRYDMRIYFLDENKSQINYIDLGGDNIYTIPLNTKWIFYSASSSGYSKLYEIQPSNEPTYSATNGYMLLIADPLKAIKEPYQMVSINYFPTSVQKLYKIGTNGEWLSYQNQAIKVNQGQTIYGKGIDKYGNETRIISSYTANVADALPKEAYDGNNTTYVYDAANYYMEVDSSMQGKNIRVYGTKSRYTMRINFLDTNKNQISYIDLGGDNIYTVPLNTKWIFYTASGSSYSKLYEIQP